MPYMTLKEAAAVIAKGGPDVTDIGLLRLGIAGHLRIVTTLTDRARSPTLHASLDLARMWLWEAIKTGDAPPFPKEFNDAQSRFLARCAEELSELKNKTQREKALFVLNTDQDAPIEKIHREMSIVHLCGLYQVPQPTLMKLEAKGLANLEYAFSLDGKDHYQPFTAITCDDLRILSPDVLRLAEAIKKASPTDKPQAAPAKHIPKQRQQENVILDWLRENCGDPKSLPKSPNGKRGPKAAAWDALQSNNGLFQSRGVFDGAWERLRADKEIQDKE